MGFGAFKALHTLPEPEIKIKIALLTQASIAAENRPQPPAPPKQTPPIPQPVITLQKPKPLETPKIQPITPAPAVVTTKPAMTPISAPLAAPTAVKTSAIEAVTEKVPAPPPAANIQAQYEDENLGRIRALLLERLKYPKNALRLKQQGDVVITFTLSPSGDASAFSITKSSEFEILDEAAQTLITTTASAFPKPSKNIRISVPVEYKIR